MLSLFKRLETYNAARRAMEAPPSVGAEPEEPEELVRTYKGRACPFCGWHTLYIIEQTIRLGSRHDGTHKVVYCDHCGTKGPLAKTDQDAIDKWNSLPIGGRDA